MDQKTVNLLVTQAKAFLTRNPYDAGHDLAHAQAVWSTAYDIAAHLDQKVDLDALQIACYWHDVVIKDKDKLNPAGGNVADTAAFLENRMKERQLPPGFIQTTIDAVRFHQFNDEPVNLEGQILWDADKLEAINADRWIHASQAVKQGKMSDAELKSYAQTGAQWLKIMRNKLHFPYSQSLFDRRYHLFISNPVIRQLAGKYQVVFN